LSLSLPAAAQSTALPDWPAWASMPASLLPMRLPVGGTPDWTVQGTAADFEAVDATPVRALSGDWHRYTPRDGRNVALQSARFELGATRQGWEVAAVLHSDILINGSRGAFDAVHAYKQRQTPADGSAFALWAHETGVVWAGLRGARSWVLRPGSDQGLQLTGALTLLSVRRVQQVDASGQVQFSTAAGYGFNAQTLRQDSHRQFGGYGRQDATGSGYTADLGLLWQPSAATFVNLSAIDLLSRIRVNGVSTQQTTLSSSTNSVDANGYLDYQPLLMGRNSSAVLDLKLSRKWSASVGTRIAWPRADMLAGARWERIDDLDLPAVWAVLPVAPGLLLQLDGEIRFRSIGLGLKSRHGALMLRTRSLPVGQSHALGWQAAFTLPL
jgi:hypothetical protein